MNSAKLHTGISDTADILQRQRSSAVTLNEDNRGIFPFGLDAE
jgi:hypothetical protein